VIILCYSLVGYASARMICIFSFAQSHAEMKAYLDIETCAGGQITVVGIYREDRGFRQLVGGEITDVTVWEALEGADILCTYNGNRFDLPILERQTRLDLRSRFQSLDLLQECRRVGLKGGLKRMEQRFGIARTTRGMNGWDALGLWARYETQGDQDALRLLLEYNREDVMNLIQLERIVVGVGLEMESQEPSAAGRDLDHRPSTIDHGPLTIDH